MGPHHLGGKQNPFGQILADLPGHVVPLGGVDHRVLVGIFLGHLFIDIVKQGKNPVIRGVGLPGQLPPVTVAHVFLSHLVAPHLHDPGLYHVLDIFHADRMGRLVDLVGHVVGNGKNLIFIHPVNVAHLAVCLLNRIDDLGQIEGHFLPIPLDHSIHYFCAHNSPRPLSHHILVLLSL